MSEQDPHEFPRDERAFVSYHPSRAFVSYHPSRANDGGRPESATHQEAPTFDDFHGSFHPFNQFSGPYSHFGNAGTPVNYQHTFQPLDFDPEYHMPTYSGAQPSSMHAPTGFHNPLIPEQPWVDEIHPSYTPVGSETFEWTPTDSRSYGWVVDAPFTSPAEQVIYANTPTTLLVDQCSPLETTASAASCTQHFVSETTPRLPLQQALSTRPASVALKVRNEKFKKGITTLPHENSGHNGHKPMRVSKTKRAEKADNNGKQEACWRCKRYRKAVSSSRCSRVPELIGQVYWPGYLQRMLNGWVSSLAVSHRVQEGSDGGFCGENNALSVKTPTT